MTMASGILSQHLRSRGAGAVRTPSLENHPMGRGLADAVSMPRERTGRGAPNTMTMSLAGNVPRTFDGSTTTLTFAPSQLSSSMQGGAEPSALMSFASMLAARRPRMMPGEPPSMAGGRPGTPARMRRS